MTRSAPDLEAVTPTQMPLPAGLLEVDREAYEAEVRRLTVTEAARLQIKQDRVDREAALLDSTELIGVDDLISTDLGGDDWLIDGLLHYQGSLLVSAAFKTGKTTMAFNMVHALTTGDPFLNEFSVPQPLKVAYFDLELGKRMARKWFIDIQPDTSLVMYSDLKGQGRKLDVRSDARYAQIVDLLKRNSIDVVIVDPLSALCASLGISENSNEEVRPLLDRLDAVVQEAGCKGLIVIHHTGKDETKGARGASAFQDWSSVNAYLTKPTEHGLSKFMAKGRDVDVKPIELEYEAPTRKLYTYGGGDVSSDFGYFFAKRGEKLTADEVKAALDISKPTALARLKAADGWKITQPGQGRRADVWEYVLETDEIPDPFA